MSEVSHDKIIFIEDLIGTDNFKLFSHGPIGFIYPHHETGIWFLKKDIKSIYSALTFKSTGNHYKVLLKDSLDESIHFKSENTPPIILIADLVNCTNLELVDFKQSKLQ